MILSQYIIKNYIKNIYLIALIILLSDVHVKQNLKKCLISAINAWCYEFLQSTEKRIPQILLFITSRGRGIFPERLTDPRKLSNGWSSDISQRGL